MAPNTNSDMFECCLKLQTPWLFKSINLVFATLTCMFLQTLPPHLYMK